MKRIKQLIIAADALLKTNVDVDAFRSWEKSISSSSCCSVGAFTLLHREFWEIHEGKEPSGPAGRDGDSICGRGTIRLESVWEHPVQSLYE